MNTVALVGRLTKDPEIRQGNSTTVARFTLAVDRRFAKDGEQTADFINCIAFNKSAEFVEKYFSKGQRMGLTGHISTGSYTNKDGNKVYTTDVVADTVEFVESKGNNSKPASKTGTDFMDIPADLEEELPFN